MALFLTPKGKLKFDLSLGSRQKEIKEQKRSLGTLQKLANDRKGSRYFPLLLVTSRYFPLLLDTSPYVKGITVILGPTFIHIEKFLRGMR